MVMLRSLDFMGPMKWPNILAVTALPAISFAWFWDFDRAVPIEMFGPEQIAGMPLLLTRPADARPRSEETSWCVRPCADCGSRLTAVSLAYGDSRPGAWAQAAPDEDRLCAALPPAGGSQRIWLKVVTADGIEAVRPWALGREP